MKKTIVIFLILLLPCVKLFSQNDLQASSGIAIEASPDILAKYPGGLNALYKYFNDHIVFQSEDIHGGIAGELVLSFIVDTSGKISAVEIKKGINSNINSEAIRIIKSMPAWIPAQSHGQLVNSRYSIFLMVDAQKLSAEPMFR